ncbi:hypothetical protein P7H71_04920 [Lactococcus lactis]|uniref:hypothetical protein n=1 Tax=Lactococcus lactis TaxID=1358 RepID=UPI00288FAD34|nr:hypothetical protein [Lactococcus lactis]MDT2882870.1 hypothetical protein [Lactococcus lactis]MDT2899881.1 hypothetical protein [Lactococcus lactis]MDT2920352.1 hypothetical protein [Lactococcus lactis]MDT2940855.1 hypothetical protein [Lactococcus lactis]MDT2970548.1 hypothetical protein [Lactococcus lactis]
MDFASLKSNNCSTMGFVGMLNLNNTNETVQMEQSKWDSFRKAYTKYFINETL